MINGTTGVYADKGGVVQNIPLSTPYTNERLSASALPAMTRRPESAPVTSAP
jgi:hypothetical protein